MDFKNVSLHSDKCLCRSLQGNHYWVWICNIPVNWWLSAELNEKLNDSWMQGLIVGKWSRTVGFKKELGECSHPCWQPRLANPIRHKASCPHLGMGVSQLHGSFLVWWSGSEAFMINQRIPISPWAMEFVKVFVFQCLHNNSLFFISLANVIALSHFQVSQSQREI